MTKSIAQQIEEQSKTLTINDTIHEFLTDQVNRLAQFVVNNLFSIAQIAVCDFGVVPSYDDVFVEAAAIARSPDSYCFDRELLQEATDYLDNAETREEPGAKHQRNYDARKGLSRKQYERLQNCAEFVLKTSGYIVALREQGYEPEPTRNDMYIIAKTDAHERLMSWRHQQDNVELARRSKLREAGKDSADSLGI